MIPPRAIRELRVAALVCFVWWTGLAEVVIRGDIPSAVRGRLFSSLCVGAAFALVRLWAPRPAASQPVAGTDNPASSPESPKGRQFPVASRRRPGPRRAAPAAVAHEDRREPVHRGAATT